MGRIVELLQHKLRMLYEDAIAVGHVVEEAFRGGSELDDEILDGPTRQLFYDLEDAKVLQIRREEFEDDGKRLRAYRWSMREEGEVQQVPAPLQRGIYERLGDDAWKRVKAVET